MKKNNNEYTTDISRIEVIDSKGRSYVNMDVKSSMISIQDDGRTMKVFINDNKSKSERFEERRCKCKKSRGKCSCER